MYDNKNTINKSIELLGMNCNIVYANVKKIMNLIIEKMISIIGFLYIQEICFPVYKSIPHINPAQILSPKAQGVDVIIFYRFFPNIISCKRI